MDDGTDTRGDVIIVGTDDSPELNVDGEGIAVNDCDRVVGIFIGDKLANGSCVDVFFANSHLIEIQGSEPGGETAMEGFEFELHCVDFSSDLGFDFGKVGSGNKVWSEFPSFGLFNCVFSTFLGIAFENGEFGGDHRQFGGCGVGGKEERGVVGNVEMVEGVDLPPLFVEEAGVAGRGR
jgi:hypothetical protein